MPKASRPSRLAPAQGRAGQQGQGDRRAPRRQHRDRYPAARAHLHSGRALHGMGGRRHRLHPSQRLHRRCYEDMRAAVEKLRTGGELKGLILDYRSNGGGIMQEAIKILGMFVPKGTEVVSTKGRTEDSRQVYRTSSEPILPRPAAGGAHQRQFGIGVGDRDRRLAGPRPCGGHRPAQLRQGACAIAAAAGLQRHAEAHHGQILHPFGPLHSGHRLLPLAGGFGKGHTRLAHHRVPDPRRAQGLRRQGASCPTSAPNPNTSAASR